MNTLDPQIIDPKVLDGAIIIGVAGWQAYWNAAFSNTPAASNYHKRSANPRVGDLVLEVTSFGLRLARGDNPEACLGTLHEIKSEWVEYEFDTEEDKAGLDPDQLGHREEATYIQLWVDPSPAQLNRWTNCKFIAIPKTLTQARGWEDERSTS